MSRDDSTKARAELSATRDGGLHGDKARLSLAATPLTCDKLALFSFLLGLASKWGVQGVEQKRRARPNRRKEQAPFVSARRRRGTIRCVILLYWVLEMGGGAEASPSPPACGSAGSHRWFLGALLAPSSDCNSVCADQGMTCILPPAASQNAACIEALAKDNGYLCSGSFSSSIVVEPIDGNMGLYQPSIGSTFFTFGLSTDF